MLDDKKRTLKLPDVRLPFFAYGIFKPGQIAHSKIRNHVKKTINNVEIHYPMKTRDGVPILIDQENDSYLTIGSLITFKEGREQNSYEIICNTMLSALYKWKTIEINGKDTNILIGVNPDNGSYYIEDSQERVCYDGKNDPLFKEAIELIKKNLQSNQFSWQEETFFELQMNYMLLWSAIDRYSSIKYNKQKQSWNNERFAKEKAFRKGILKFKENHHRPVYSTDDLKIHEFDTENPYETLLYYYTIRCNVVHRGKSMYKDYKLLKTATEELLEIFEDTLKNAFYEIE